MMHEINEDVSVRTCGVELPGTLTAREGAGAIVVFAHGSGSSRLSPRNKHVAKDLRDAGLATLLFDLLTDEESEDRDKVFDIELLAERLGGAADWLRADRGLDRAAVGYFGASTGAAAALVAAADDERIGAIVSRGGRPDLAGDALGRVRAPTLLIVGGNDEPVIRMNRDAIERLRCEKDLQIVPGATHLFEEPGALEQVSRLACDWFTWNLGAGRAASGGGGVERDGRA